MSCEYCQKFDERVKYFKTRMSETHDVEAKLYWEECIKRLEEESALHRLKDH